MHSGYIKNNQVKLASVLSYFYIGVSVIVGLLYTPFLVRFLGKSEYGLYNTVTSVISMISMLSLGFNSGYIQFYTKYKRNNDNEAIQKLNGLYLIIFTIIGLLCFLCGIFLSFNLDLIYKSGLTSDEYDIAKWLMILLTVNLTISMPMSVFQHIIIAHERFVFLKLLAIIKMVVSPVVTIPLLLMGYKSIAMVIVTLIIHLSVDIIYAYYVLFVLKCKFKFRGIESGLFKNIFSYTFFIALHLLTDQINTNVDKVLLGRFKGTESISMYSVGYSIYVYSATIGTAINGIFTPRIHNIVEQRSDKNLLKNNLTDLFVKVGRVQFVILSLIASGFVFFGKEFIFYWAGAGYEDAYYVALLLMIPGLIDLIQNIGIEMQRAQNLHRFRAYVYIGMALINIVLSIYLCQLYGAIGSAVGTAISFIVVQGLIINIYYQKKCNLDIPLFWKNIFRMCLGLVIPVIVGILIRHFIIIDSLLLLIGLIAGYTIVFALSMWFFGINKYEKGLIINLKNKIFKGDKNGVKGTTKN